MHWAIEQKRVLKLTETCIRHSLKESEQTENTGSPPGTDERMLTDPALRTHLFHIAWDLLKKVKSRVTD